jgi:hypothetical protein
MSLVTRPAVVLCPPLAVGQQAPAWHDALVQALHDVGIRSLAPTVTRGTGGAATPPGTPAEAGSPEDRLAIAGWVADQAVAITMARLDLPLILVSTGAANRGLPALGLSQRAARHTVVGYVMVDGPAAGPSRADVDWPDAPVLYVRTPGAQLHGLPTARLRGWSTVIGDPVATVVAHARAWPDRRI